MFVKISPFTGMPARILLFLIYSITVSVSFSIEFRKDIAKHNKFCIKSKYGSVDFFSKLHFGIDLNYTHKNWDIELPALLICIFSPVELLVIEVCHRLFVLLFDTIFFVCVNGYIFFSICAAEESTTGHIFKMQISS